MNNKGKKLVRRRDPSPVVFEKLLALFQEVLDTSEEYHIAKIIGLGYVSITGRYEPGINSDQVLNKIMFERYFRLPEEMAEDLLENLRWQWYEKNSDSVCIEDYYSICEMDEELSREEYPDYFEMLEYYEEEVNQILRHENMGF